jgi:Asp-tRNA(Asn)/Glu-tRNA(Gln) amidotransferase A subunit family amidase
VIPLATSDPPPLTSHTKREAFNHQIKEVPNRYWSIADFHDAYLSGKLTPLEVVESMLPLIRRDVTPRSDHSVAFVDINVDLVLRAARASTQRYKDGNSLGILDGVPVGVKDELHIAGYRTYSGRKPDPELFKVQTDTVWPVRKWEESGAIMMGKLNMHQIGSDTTNLNVRAPLNREVPRLTVAAQLGHPTQST